MGDKTSVRIGVIIVAGIVLLSALPVLPGNVGLQEQRDLPPPEHVNMPLEEAICRRMSVRAFTAEAIGEQQLSTLLWHAYGVIDGQRTIHPVAATYGLHIYVLMEDAAYRYDPENHSLDLFRRGDYR